MEIISLRLTRIASSNVLPSAMVPGRQMPVYCDIMWLLFRPYLAIFQMQLLCDQSQRMSNIDTNE